ncbi:hypothetical protein AB9Q10_45375 [Streptomyces krungchingensis]|uniref:DUF4760 domain-containing protein n=1 Tax=Streptomyces krungchingensis TaxID=1565034 RepID=UPI003CFB9A5C
MDGATLWNVLAIAISVSAVLASMWFGARQVQIARQANYIPALMDLLAEFRSAELHEQYAYVCRDLNREHAPDGGLRGLPPDAKAAVYNVAYFFQTLAGLYALGVIDETAAIVMARGRIAKVWQAIEPFVEQERRFPDVDQHLLALLQAYAAVSPQFTGPSSAELIQARWHSRHSTFRQRLLGRRRR